MTDIQALAQFATVRQLEYLDAIKQHGSATKAAAALVVNRRGVDQSLRALRMKAAAHGYSPEHDLTRPLAPGQMLRGASTLYRRGESEPVLQWVKSSADAEAQAAIQRAALEAMAQDIPRLSAIVPVPGNHRGDLCTVYTLTDSHVGMLAWGKESGADWDLKIAERTLVGCFAGMIAASPPASIGFISQLGDFLHYDSALAAVTPIHGHSLDADGRMPKMVTSAIRILRTVIDMALHKHDRVVVLLAEGNHDVTSSVWLRAMFQALYENEPRIQVIDSELPYYQYQHGSTMLAFHHGHLHKLQGLPILFAAQFPEVWGATTKRYCHTGHRHHVEEKEHSGMTVIQHPTLAARDAYAARGGWIAERQVTSITYSSKFGQVARHTVTPEMLGDQS